MRHLKEYAQKIAVSIIPPIITAGIRAVWNRFLKCCAQPSSLLHPSEYSTLDNPLEVPAQVEAYLLCRDKYLKPTDTILDLGFGLGYGLQIMAAKVNNLVGIDVDPLAVKRGCRIFEEHPHIRKVMLYDGKRLPFEDKTFDVVTCVEVIEHTENYKGMLLEMARVARRSIFITTPNRQPQNTLPNGQPRNYWHLREWTMSELDAILVGLGFKYEWNCLNGPFEGPFTVTDTPTENTFSLVPVISAES
ncbi:methyltransferase domain-containing protein [Verrucomicrobiota bacterium]